jgi:hypothetical protein
VVFMTDTTNPTDLAGAIDLATTIDTYLAGYCEPDPDARATLIAAAWAPDGELLDPPLAGRGHAELAALTDAVLTHFPGHAFRRTSAVDSHHDCARYTWELVAPDGEIAVAGTDFVELADSGMIRRVVGFFGPLAAE